MLFVQKKRAAWMVRLGIGREFSAETCKLSSTPIVLGIKVEGSLTSASACHKSTYYDEPFIWVPNCFLIKDQDYDRDCPGISDELKHEGIGP